MNEKEGFNSMIKKVIENDVLNYAIGLADDMGDWLYVRNWICIGQRSFL